MLTWWWKEWSPWINSRSRMVQCHDTCYGTLGRTCRQDSWKIMIWLSLAGTGRKWQFLCQEEFYDMSFTRAHWVRNGMDYLDSRDGSCIQSGTTTMKRLFTYDHLETNTELNQENPSMGQSRGKIPRRPRSFTMSSPLSVVGIEKAPGFCEEYGKVGAIHWRHSLRRAPPAACWQKA